MTTIKINDYDLLEMLVNRVRFWTDDEEVINLYSDYYENFILGGCFEGAEVDINLIVDNDYINYTQVITNDEFEDYNIESEDDERIIAKNNGLYLIQTY